MPLANAITVLNTDHFSRGGIRTLQLATPDATTAITDDGDGTLSGCVLAGAGIVNIDFEKETAKVTVSASQEKGLMLYTVSIEAYIPKCSGAKFKALSDLRGEMMIARCTMWDGIDLLVGYDFTLGKIASGGTFVVNDSTNFGLVLESIEADSGAALSDQNGVTLKLTSVQGEPPYEALFA